LANLRLKSNNDSNAKRQLISLEETKREMQRKKHSERGKQRRRVSFKNGKYKKESLMPRDVLLLRKHTRKLVKRSGKEKQLNLKTKEAHDERRKKIST